MKQLPIGVLVTVSFLELLAVLGFLIQHTVEKTKPVSPTLTCLAPQSRDQGDMCVWVHPADGSQSTIITSDKQANRLFVYDLEGKVIQSLPVPRPGSIDVRYKFPLAGQPVICSVSRKN